MGLEIIPPFQVPLLNTLILLMRGVTATLAHQELLGGQKTD
jgi:heme/copper-type cytochrome/quinol oxidase subunit 3